jgi:hypothetical protein
MRADPRGIAVDTRRTIRVFPTELLGRRPPDVALRSGINTAGFGPGVSLGHCGSADIAGWLACVAIAALQPDTRGYSIELGDVSAGTAARIL